MKKLLSTLLLAFVCIAATAQKEEDFASRYMTLYGEGTSLSCATVSPSMIERMMQLPAEEDNASIKQVLSHLKSIRVVTAANPEETPRLHEQAEALAKKNARRYKPYANDGNKSVYMRRRGELILEIVLIASHPEGTFSIVNLTGNMDDDFISQLLKI